MSFPYLVTALPPSVCTCSVVLSFLPHTPVLVIARGSILDWSLLVEDGLRPLFSLSLFGTISTMHVMEQRTERRTRRAGGGKSAKKEEEEEGEVLFVWMENNQFCVLGADATGMGVRTIAKGDFTDRIGRRVALPMMSFDETGSIGVFHIYEGMLKVLPVDFRSG